MQHLHEKIYGLRDAFDRIGGFATISSDLKFMSVTDPFISMMGYTEEEVKGRNIHFINHAEFDAVNEMQMIRHLYKGGTWIGDIICQHKDGQALEMRLTIAPSIQDGVIEGYIAQYQRTIVQHSTFDLDDVLYRYRSGFNKIAGLAIVDSSAQIQEVNDLFVEMFGYSREEALGKNIGFLSRSASQEMPAAIWSVVGKGQVYTGEVENFDNLGRSVHARLTVAPANYSDSRVIANFDMYLVIYQDITKETEMRSRQQALAVEAVKQQMLHGAIHNVSNLQQGVLAANNKTLVLTEGLNAAVIQASEHYKTLSTLEDKSAFLDAVYEVLKVSVPEIATSVQEERKAIDESVAVINSFRREQRNARMVSDVGIAGFVQSLLNTFSLQAATQHIAVAITSMADVDVRWPTEQVHQIAFNLLINAQQAIAEQVETGRIAATKGRIEILIGVFGDDVSLSVKDNGGGFVVPVEKLFTPRFTTKASGSGIGLHTSSIMAQSMGGTLTAQNVGEGADRGACFTLTIPRIIQAQGA
jgi:PAS domain S-box-containing protein